MRFPLRRALALGLAGGALLAACVGHRPPPSPEVSEMAFRNHVRTLSSDDFEGRRPGTPGEEKTVAYLVEQFRKMGLKPGLGESYVQAVPMVEITAGADAALGFAGQGVQKPLENGKDMVIWSPHEVPEASLQHSDLVFLGYGIVAPEFHWNDYEGTDVHGKTVVVLVGDPGYATKDPRVFHGNAGTYYGRWTYKVEEAARHGAAGVLLIHDPGASGSAWNTVVSDRSGPQFEPPAGAGQTPRSLIEGWITLNAARAVFKFAGLNFDAVADSAARQGFKSVAVGLTTEATVHNTLRRITSSNVVAVLPGSNRKREYVIYTAHWDHLGRDAAGIVRNGAVADASGVAALLVLAQSLSRTHPAPDRSVVFIAFTGTESGLLGSSYYVEHPVFSLRETVGVINLDLLHIGGPTRDVMVIGYGNSELEDFVRESAMQQGREVRPDPFPEQGFYYRSDEFSFARIGVPALDVKAGADDSARGPAWGREQFNDYMAHRYHQAADKYTPDWDVRGTVEDLRMYRDVGVLLAQSRRFPRFYPDSEFRPNHTP